MENRISNIIKLLIIMHRVDTDKPYVHFQFYSTIFNLNFLYAQKFHFLSISEKVSFS